MGAIDKFINAMKINTDVVDDYDYEEDMEFDDVQESRSFFKQDKEANEEKVKKPSKVSSFSAKKKSVNYGMEIKSYRPESIEESTFIIDDLLDGNSVIINVSGIDVATARQILDFTSGGVYALKGTFKKITDSIFVAVPAGINIDGVFDEKMGE